MKNKTTAIIVLLMIGTIAASVAANYFTKPEEVKIETEKEDTANKPYVVRVDKEKFKNMNEHDFVSAVSPTVEANFGSALYTTFDFGDGTGIYFPFSDISKSASYANLDSEGFPSTVIGTITINGQHVEYQELNGACSPESKEIASYVDESYFNDFFGTAIKDGTLYANIMLNADSELDAESGAIEFVRNLINNGYKGDVDQYYISVDREYLYVVSKDLSSVTYNPELLESTLEYLF